MAYLNARRTRLPAIKALVGANLTQFKIVVVSEVWRVNGRNYRKIEDSVMFFTTPYLADAYIGVQDNPNLWMMGKVLVLTNDVVSYSVEGGGLVTVTDEKTAREMISEKCPRHKVNMIRRTDAS
jgi:hypothetical protein